MGLSHSVFLSRRERLRRTVQSGVFSHRLQCDQARCETRLHRYQLVKCTRTAAHCNSVKGARGRILSMFHTAEYEERAPRRLAFRHSLPVRHAAGGPAGTRSTPNEEHQVSVLESETDPTHALALAWPARAAPHGRLALALHRRASARAGEHEIRFHTSYSRRRLDTNCCCHTSRGGKRSSASRYARATELSR